MDTSGYILLLYVRIKALLAMEDTKNGNKHIQFGYSYSFFNVRARSRNLIMMIKNCITKNALILQDQKMVVHYQE